MSNVRYQVARESTLEISGGDGVGVNSNGGSVTIQSGLVDLGGHGGPASLIASNSIAYITSPATPGFLVISFSPPFGAGTDPTGLSNDATLYDVSLTFDSGGGDVTQTVTITGSTAQTFDDLITQVNLQIGLSYVDAVFTGPIAPADPTGLSNDATVYTFEVQVDSQPVTHVVSVTGSTAQTFGTLITAINVSMVGATASIVGGNLRVQSNGTVPPVIIATLFDTGLFGSITPNTFVGFNATVTALGIMSNLGGTLQITSNGCGGGCFGTGSNIIDNGADTQIYLFGALTNFAGPTATFSGDAAGYSQTNGANTFIKAGDSGGTGIGGDYAGVGAGHITLQAGNASNNILSGALNRENGGPVDIFGGDGGGNQAVGGHVNLRAGTTGSGAVKGGDGGNVTLFAGNTTGDFNTFFGKAGNVALNAGDGTHGALPGDIVVNAGSADGTPGYLNENFINNPAPISGTTPSGLGPGIYDVSFTVNGGAPFTVTLSPGTNFPTFQDVVNELNSQLIDAQASILNSSINGHIHIQTNTTTHTSTIVDNDFPVYGGANTYLFGAMNQWGNSEDGPVPGTDPPGGDIHMETVLTGEVFLKGTAEVRFVSGVQNSAKMTFSSANTAGASNRNITHYTGNTSTNPSPNVFTVDDIDPDTDTITTRGSVPIKEVTCQAFRLMVSAINEAVVLPATEFASWHIEGTIARGNLTAASTALVGAVTSIKRDSGGNAAGWTVTVTADTTLGGLIITVTTPAFTGAGVSFGIDLELISQR